LGFVIANTIINTVISANISLDIADVPVLKADIDNIDTKNN